MKQTLFLVLIGSSIIAGVFALNIQETSALECSWTESEYRCTDGYWTSEYQCTWYDPPPYQSCQPSTTYETQCGWEVQCDADDTNCHMAWVCKQVAVPSQNCTTVDPAPYQTCEWNSVWVPGSCGNYPTYKSQTCPANSETSCSYATDCSTTGSKNVTSYSCGTSGCQSSTTTATCTRTFPTCTNNVGETGYVCGSGCTAPPNKTLNVSITATPSSGPAPLRNVKIDATVGGTATGTITYKLDCTNDGAFDDSATSDSTSFTFTKKCDYLAAGSYTAKVEVSRQTLTASNTAGITVTPASQCAAPQSLVCTYNSSVNTITLSWDAVGSVKSYLMEWAKSDKNYGDPTATSGGTARLITEPKGNTFGINNKTAYKFHARAETSSGSACGAPGAWSADQICYAGTCDKRTTPAFTDSFSLQVPTSDSTKTCNLTVEHLTADLTDNSAVSFETRSSGTNARTIAMDDNPSVECDDNLEFTNVWTPSTGLLQLDSGANSKPSTHDHSFGYNLTTSGCYIAGASANRSCSSDPQSNGENACSTPTISVDRKTATKKHGIKDLDSAVLSSFNFNLVECTQNSQCTSDPNKGKCNLDPAITTSTGYPQNTCIDSIAPTSRIRRIEDGPGKLPGFLYYPSTGAYSAFLRADNNGETKKTWWLLVEDSDEGGAGINTCHISFNGIEKTAKRICNTWVSFTVGRVATGADCAIDPQNQGDNKCTVKVWATDNAKNVNLVRTHLDDISKDERPPDGNQYLSRNFNEINFGVDYTPPSVQ